MARHFLWRGIKSISQVKLDGGYGYVPLRFGGNVVRRMGTQQQKVGERGNIYWDLNQDIFGPGYSQR